MAERKLIGRVGVDSGQLLIIDPCYIEDHWENNGTTEAIRFWGAGQEQVADILKQQGQNPTYVNHSYRLPLNEQLNEEQAHELVDVARKSIKDVVIIAKSTTNSYDKVCDLTLSKEQAGTLPYRRGHEGLAVAFSSGFGDGVYDVYATYQDYGGCTGADTRIKKVEIILIED